MSRLPEDSRMLRIFLIVLGVGVAALAAGFVTLGTMKFPPRVQQMHVVLPKDHFGNP